jgi:hypothetical protein
MQDTSFVVAPIRDHAFFSADGFRMSGRKRIPSGTVLAAQILHLPGGRGTRGVTGQPALAGLHELLDQV